MRAAGNFGNVSSAVREKVAALARDPSPEVQLQVAIASRKIKGFDALPVLSDVLAHCGQDKLIPSIAWNNLHPLLETESARFVSLILSEGRVMRVSAVAANRQRGARLDMNERYANRSARAADDAIDLVFEERQVGTGCEDEGARKPDAQEREE